MQFLHERKHKGGGHLVQKDARQVDHTRQAYVKELSAFRPLRMSQELIADRCIASNRSCSDDVPRSPVGLQKEALYRTGQFE